ncbi:MAG: hypothetical protein B6243_09655 [Anaerolineaceae bacterium 4572_5.2]|nr:MAG: hypothetical protein B6243_09655 [Anaerolineaceae bacterium 4572_5.2]
MLRLLLVDDEPLILRSLQKTLMRSGFDVETAGDCSAGLTAFKTAQGEDTPFALALLDLNMPSLDGEYASGAGLELLSRLLELQPDFPVVVLTAYDEVNKAKEAVSRGAKAYFVKGREQELVALINDILIK